ncbi:alpha-carbonyl methylesterase [Pseudoscourfieldia marina]
MPALLTSHPVKLNPVVESRTSPSSASASASASLGVDGGMRSRSTSFRVPAPAPLPLLESTKSKSSAAAAAAGVKTQSQVRVGAASAVPSHLLAGVGGQVTRARRARSTATVAATIREGTYIVNESLFVAQLSARLMRFFVCRFVWLRKLARLVLYFFCLLPAFARCFLWYAFDGGIRRSVPYRTDPRRRNDCDVYVPDETRWPGPRPVCVYVTGGAWIIGYKAWGLLLCRWLRERGWLVVSLDYRNFPQASVTGMVDDVNAGVDRAVHELAERFGGDPEKLCLIGQSAGAHLVLTAALACAERNDATWLSGVKLLVGVSGVYDVEAIAPKMIEMGLPRSLLYRLMAIKDVEPIPDGDGDIDGDAETNHEASEDPDVRARLRARSPTFVARGVLKSPEAVARLPPVVLYHGETDRSSPPKQSTDLHAVLSSGGVASSHVLLQGKGHTEPVLTDLMRGDKALSSSVSSLPAFDVESGDLELSSDAPWTFDLLTRMESAVGGVAESPSESLPLAPRLAPDWMVRLAVVVSPF